MVVPAKIKQILQLPNKILNGSKKTYVKVSTWAIYRTPLKQANLIQEEAAKATCCLMVHT